MQQNTQAQLRFVFKVVGAFSARKAKPLNVVVDRQGVGTTDDKILLSPGRRLIKVSCGRAHSNLLALEVDPDDTVIIEVSASTFARIEMWSGLASTLVLLVSLYFLSTENPYWARISLGVLLLFTIVIPLLPLKRLNARRTRPTESATVTVASTVSFTCPPTMAVFVDSQACGTTSRPFLIASGYRNIYVCDGFGRSNSVARNYLAGSEVALQVTAKKPARAVFATAFLVTLLVFVVCVFALVDREIQNDDLRRNSGRFIDARQVLLSRERQNMVLLGMLLGAGIVCMSLGYVAGRVFQTLKLVETPLPAELGKVQNTDV